MLLPEEVRGTGVTVTVLCPGPVATGLQERAELHRSDLLKGGVRVMDARTVARAAVAGVERGAVRVIPGATNKATAVLPRLVPRAVVPSMVKRLQDHSD